MGTGCSVSAVAVEPKKELQRPDGNRPRHVDRKAVLPEVARQDGDELRPHVQKEGPHVQKEDSGAFSLENSSKESVAVAGRVVAADSDKALLAVEPQAADAQRRPAGYRAQRRSSEASEDSVAAVFALGSDFDDWLAAIERQEDSSEQQLMTELQVDGAKKDDPAANSASSAPHYYPWFAVLSGWVERETANDDAADPEDWYTVDALRAHLNDTRRAITNQLVDEQLALAINLQDEVLRLEARNQQQLADSKSRNAAPRSENCNDASVNTPPPALEFEDLPPEDQDRVLQYMATHRSLMRCDAFKTTIDNACTRHMRLVDWLEDHYHRSVVRKWVDAEPAEQLLVEDTLPDESPVCTSGAMPMHVEPTSTNSSTEESLQPNLGESGQLSTISSDPRLLNCVSVDSPVFGDFNIQCVGHPGERFEAGGTALGTWNVEVCVGSRHPVAENHDIDL